MQLLHLACKQVHAAHPPKVPSNSAEKGLMSLVCKEMSAQRSDEPRVGTSGQCKSTLLTVRQRTLIGKAPISRCTSICCIVALVGTLKVASGKVCTVPPSLYKNLCSAALAATLSLNCCRPAL